MIYLSSRPRPCRIVVPILAALAIAIRTAGQSTADEAADVKTAAEAKPGDSFVKLFEGDKDKTWVGYNKEAWPEGWELADGVLHRKAAGGDLQTVEEYGDFDLRFGWKVAKGGNSGVMYRVSREKGPAYETGPEYQVLDNAVHRDGKSPLTSSGSLYALYAPASEAMRPASGTGLGSWSREIAFATF